MNRLATLLMFLLIQSRITPPATFVDMAKAGSGPTNGCTESCLVKLASDFISINPSVLTPRLVWSVSEIIKGLNGHLAIRENIDVPTHIAIFYFLPLYKP